MSVDVCNGAQDRSGVVCRDLGRLNSACSSKKVPSAVGGFYQLAGLLQEEACEPGQDEPRSVSAVVRQESGKNGEKCSVLRPFPSGMNPITPSCVGVIAGIADSVYRSTDNAESGSQQEGFHLTPDHCFFVVAYLPPNPIAIRVPSRDRTRFSRSLLRREP